MKRGERAGICILLFRVRVAGADGTEPKSLYHDNKGGEVMEAVGSQKSPPVYRGIVAAVYGDDRRAEPILKAVIRSGPQSDDGYEAYEWLTHIYLRTGQYRQLIANMEARWAAFPN